MNIKQTLKKFSLLKAYLSMTLLVILIGGIVFTAGFGICLYMARTQITTLTDKGVMRDMDVIHNYVDGQLQCVEEIAYSLTWADNRDYAVLSLREYDTEEEMFVFLENVLNIHPNLCGIAIGLEPQYAQNLQGKYGFAVYVTNVSGQNQRLRLGEINDYRNKEWYCKSFAKDASYWSLPFRESNMGHVVTCFSLPLHDPQGHLIGVMAIDINTEAFRQKCNEIVPFANAEVTLVDREFRYISHPDTSLLLHNVTDYNANQWSSANKQTMKSDGKGRVKVGNGKDKAFFYFDTIERTGWIIGIQCPEKEVYSIVNTMRRNTTLIAILSVVVMILSFGHLFRRLQKVSSFKATIDKELKIASDIQMSMTPRELSSTSDSDKKNVYGLLHPARDVGGDLYDYFLKNDYLYFCIGDVSGKGIPASLFMSATHYLFRSMAESFDDVAYSVAAMNRSLSVNNEKLMFVTFFFGRLNLLTGKLDYCNAGHNAPILISKNNENKAQFINADAGIALGVWEEFAFSSQSLQMEDGDSLLLYTDGVTEAMNVKNEELGNDETLACAAQHTGETPDAIVNALLQRIRQHTVNAEQSDDITMLCIRYDKK